MDIEKCYELLEVNRDATPDQVKQAYKDLVNIWHPDRVPNIPRLKQKAEDKLKEINTAYEKVNLHLSAPKPNTPKSDANPSSSPEPTEEERTKPKHKPENYHFQSRTETRAESEPVIHHDQSIFLNLWSSFSSLFRQIFTDMQSRMDKVDAEAWREPNNSGRGHGRGRCMARGKGMGRGRGNRMGRGGMGRGKGR